MKKLIMLCVLSAITTLLPVEDARAAAYEITPGVEAREEYNDNLILDGVDTEGDYISSVIPSLKVSLSTERTEAVLSGKFDAYWYADHDEYNAVDRQASLDFSHALSRVLTTGFTAEYKKDSKIDRDLELTGMTTGTAVREKEKYSTRLDWNTSEISTINLTLAYDEEDYDDPEYVDFVSRSVSTGWAHGISNLINSTVGQVACTYTEYDYRNSTISNSLLSLGLAHQLNELWDLGFSLGPNYIRTHYGTDNEELEEKWGTYIYGTLNRKGFYNKFSSVLSRSEEAVSGRDGTVDRITFKLLYEHRPAKKIRYGGVFRYYRNRSDTGFHSRDVNEHHYHVTPRISYEIRDNVFVEASYLYTFIKDKDESLDKERNQVAIRLYWSMPVIGRF
ncbi:MAG: hypothetical protein KKG47_09600 [Proteobacteria bacterium]|nr:hypothetical protein [Pseudomonadota bacterium]MBU1736872.1 hypothetical protein [Pseudomonadota bacterium]